MKPTAKHFSLKYNEAGNINLIPDHRWILSATERDGVCVPVCVCALCNRDRILSHAVCALCWDTFLHKRIPFSLSRSLFLLFPFDGSLAFLCVFLCIGTCLSECKLNLFLIVVVTVVVGVLPRCITMR